MLFFSSDGSRTDRDQRQRSRLVPALVPWARNTLAYRIHEQPVNGYSNSNREQTENMDGSPAAVTNV
jgi:hypothetical protein